MFHTIKQLEEKNVANEIVHMSWSDRMDLVAYATVKGEVALHRLTWTRAWNLAPPLETSTVKGLAWRPDGKVLAIAYSNGEVRIVSIENKVVSKTIETCGDITCIQWVQEKNENKNKSNDNLPFSTNEDDQPNYMQYIDLSSVYLSEPPMLLSVENMHAEENQKPNILHEQSELNILLIGSKEGIIYVNIFGAFSCIQLNMNQYLGVHCSVENILSTEDLSKLFVTLKDQEHNIHILVIDSSIFKTNKNELLQLL
ncbi:hypothetical protein WA026_013059 [Henosepilachna vigintioctopunctata]|uniref:Anaphase-promoting complex subunit 4-like WD40 domain-containing protein n=1 Tax=Henosepilachna vigintioctopunctata TaxID=420089 RepID=A0AAW1UDZ0_9CUCU